MNFQKIYRTHDIGQILVKQDSNDDEKPEVRFYFEPKDLGVCSISVTFTTWDSSDEYFESIDIQKSHDIVKPTIDRIIKNKLKL